MKLFGTFDKFREQFLVEIDVESEKAQFIDNIGNELWQPQVIQRNIVGKLVKQSPLWTEFVESLEKESYEIRRIDEIDYFSADLQIDFDIYLKEHTFLNITNGIVKIVVVQNPLEIDEGNFSEEQYLNKVKERNFGERAKVSELSTL